MCLDLFQAQELVDFILKPQPGSGFYTTLKGCTSLPKPAWGGAAVQVGFAAVQR